MKRRGSYWVVGLVALLMACAPRAPQKPSGLPSESFWVGTRKSGVFVVLGPIDRDGWRVKLYDDHTGAVKAEGLYVLRGLGRAELGPSDVVSFDGTALHLADGALLVPKVNR